MDEPDAAAGARQWLSAAHTRRCAVLSTLLREPGDTAVGVHSALRQAGVPALFRDAAPSALFIDLDALREAARELHGAGWPAGTLHTFAVKANPLAGVLRALRDAGLGAEAASMGELAVAASVGFPRGTLVFDSPVKTKAELRAALDLGARVNVDNLTELARLAEVVDSERGGHPHGKASCSGGETAAGDAGSASAAGSAVAAAEAAGGGGGGGGGGGVDGVKAAIIGVRVNPQVGTGSITALSTGGEASKFGVPLREQREALLQAFERHVWLNALHLHVGSQGVPVDLIVAGVEAVHGLMEEVNARCGERRVVMLDIGGGTTVDFSRDDAPATPQWRLLAARLRERLPSLWGASSTDPAPPLSPSPSPRCQYAPPQLVTENGRSLLAKAGWAATRVEYAKSCGGQRFVACHLGADMFLRACYLPDTWPLRLFVCDARGRPKEALQDPRWLEQNVVGPCCFSGDVLAHGRRLPLADEGDVIVVADAGAYTLSMYSRYNSRCVPPVIGHSMRSGNGGSGGSGSSGSSGSSSGGSGEAPAVDLVVLKRGESVDDVVKFWSE